MKFGLTDQIIAGIEQVFETNSKVDKAFIFGSRAKGNFRDGSDIDIAIKGRELSFKDIISLSGKLEDLDIPYKIDLLNYHTINEPALQEHIDRVGIEFYSRCKQVRLGKLCTKIGSGATPTGGSNAYKTEGISLIRSQNVLDFKFGYDGLAFIDDEQAFALKNVTAHENDILLNITGDSVARVCKVPSEVLPARVNQHVAILRANNEKLNSDFLLYQLQAKKENLLILSEIGGTRNALTKVMIEEFEITLPPLPEQTAIASILSSLDDKIDLLNRQNCTLEQLAETLFRQWFVEEAEESWEEKRLSELLDFVVDNRGKTAPTADEGIPLIATNCIKNGNIFPVYEKIRYISEETYSNWFRAHPKPGDIIFVNKGTPGCVNLVPDPIDFCIAQDMIALRVNKNLMSNYFLFLYFRSGAIQSQIENSSVGTTIPHLKKTDLLRFIITIPDISIINEFDEIVEPLFIQMNKNYLQIRTLTQTRDTLLQKLMSGEVRVYE